MYNIHDYLFNINFHHASQYFLNDTVQNQIYCAH